MRHTAMRLFLATLVLSLSAIPAAGRSEEDATGQKIIVHLSHSSEDLHAASMALALATNLQGGGASVTLFLDLEGVRLADARTPKHLRWGSSPPVSEGLDSFVRAGGAVLLCAHCAHAAGVDASTLHPGAKIGTEAEIRAAFLAAEKVIDY